MLNVDNNDDGRESMEENTITNKIISKNEYEMLTQYYINKYK